MSLDADRFEKLTAVIEELAGGNLRARYPISRVHDDVDAIGFGVNCLAEELSLTIRRVEKVAAERRTKERELEIAARRELEISDELHNLRTARLASIGVLAAGIGHEINNPLTYVLSNLELAQQRLVELLPADAGPDAAEIHELIDESCRGADRIRRITQDLRLFSRVDEVAEEPVDVPEVMESCLAMVGNEIRHRAQLVREYQEVPPVLASEPRLTQVFVNLLVNAAHSLAVGDASDNTICVAIRCEEERRVVIEIADTGLGIGERDLLHVFDPFFSTKPRGEGTGLGLPICRELVSKMGGDISLASTVGAGTTVRVVLPAADAMRTEAQQVAPARGVAALPSARILIIDDEALVAKALSRMLAGAETSIALGGRDALALLERETEFDLIFCDLMMPETSGIDVFQSVEKTAPELARRFIFMTGGAFTERADRFLAEVSNPCIQKPFHSDQLNGLVRERLAKLDAKKDAHFQHDSKPNEGEQR